MTIVLNLSKNDETCLYLKEQWILDIQRLISLRAVESRLLEVGLLAVTGWRLTEPQRHLPEFLSFHTVIGVEFHRHVRGDVVDLILVERHRRRVGRNDLQFSIFVALGSSWVKNCRKKRFPINQITVNTIDRGKKSVRWRRRGYRTVWSTGYTWRFSKEICRARHGLDILRSLELHFIILAKHIYLSSWKHLLS